MRRPAAATAARCGLATPGRPIPASPSASAMSRSGASPAAARLATAQRPRLALGPFTSWAARTWTGSRRMLRGSRGTRRTLRRPALHRRAAGGHLLPAVVPVPAPSATQRGLPPLRCCSRCHRSRSFRRGGRRHRPGTFVATDPRRTLVPFPHAERVAAADLDGIGLPEPDRRAVRALARSAGRGPVGPRPGRGPGNGRTPRCPRCPGWARRPRAAS